MRHTVHEWTANPATETPAAITQQMNTIWQEVFELTGVTPEDLIRPAENVGIWTPFQTKTNGQSERVKTLLARYFQLKRKSLLSNRLTPDVS